MMAPVRFAAVSLLVACAAPAAPAPSPALSPPPAADPWSLSFEYAEGYVADPIQWGVTIGASGPCSAWWRRWKGLHWGEPFEPTSEMRARLREVVERAGLREMPATLADGADCDRLRLALTDETGVHSVTVWCPAMLARQPEATDVARRDAIRRCFTVVAEVLRMQPSPIEWQTPEACESLARGE